MPTFSDPLVLLGIIAGSAGLFLLAHARLQAKLLRDRIAHGIGTAVVDPATGLFSAAAAMECIRAETNRAARLDRALDVWVGTAASPDLLDTLGTELAFQLPAGSTGVRLSRERVCVLSCVGAHDVAGLVDALTWRTIRVDAGEHAERAALTFISGADAHAA